MVSTHLKNISQMGSFCPGIGVKIKNLWVATTQIMQFCSWGSTNWFVWSKSAAEVVFLGPKYLNTPWILVYLEQWKSILRTKYRNVGRNVGRNPAGKHTTIVRQVSHPGFLPMNISQAPQPSPFMLSSRCPDGRPKHFAVTKLSRPLKPSPWNLSLLWNSLLNTMPSFRFQKPFNNIVDKRTSRGKS